jgi:hypothetical protein
MNEVSPPTSARILNSTLPTSPAPGVQDSTPSPETVAPAGPLTTVNFPRTASATRRRVRGRPVTTRGGKVAAALSPEAPAGVASAAGVSPVAGGGSAAVW